METSHAQHLERGTGSIERQRDEPLNTLHEQSDAASQLPIGHLERGTGSVERRRGEPLDALRQQSDAASQLRLRQTAIERGQKRIQEAEEFSRQEDQEIAIDNEKCVKDYEDRYSHKIYFIRNDKQPYFEIQTSVNGAGSIYPPCYANRVFFRKASGDGEGYDHIFYARGNFKRRLPYSRPDFKADADITCKETKPLPHVDILFNQIRAANEYLAQHRESDWPTQFDLGIYFGHHIVNASDREIFETLHPEETGEVVFQKGTDGYKAIAGCDTGKAKWMLAARLGKEISKVKLIKSKEKNKKGELKTRYYTKYHFETIPKLPQGDDNTV